MANYDDFYNENDVPVIFVNAEGIIVKMNPIFAETYQWTVEQLVGQPLVNIIPTGLQDAHNMGFSRFLLSGISNLLDTPIDLEIMMGNGETMLAEHYIVSFSDDGKQVLAAKIVPRL